MLGCVRMRCWHSQGGGRGGSLRPGGGGGGPGGDGDLRFLGDGGGDLLGCAEASCTKLKFIASSASTTTIKLRQGLVRAMVAVAL